MIPVTVPLVDDAKLWGYFCCGKTWMRTEYLDLRLDMSTLSTSAFSLTLAHFLRDKPVKMSTTFPPCFEDETAKRMPPKPLKTSHGPHLVTTTMASNRQPVAKGGLWSSHAAPVSNQTQALLKSRSAVIIATISVV